MAMRRCDADEHHYDDNKHSSCPYCRSTMPYIPKESTPKENRDEAVTVLRPSPSLESNDAELGKTRIYGLEHEQIPVVGWLVVLSSPLSPGRRDSKGRDFRLIPGMNRVGRNLDMEISTDFGDDKICRNTHCIVTFDPESNRFFVSTGEGRNLTYVSPNPSEDDEDEGGWDVVLQPRRLNYLDRIKVGDTIFVFVPFCCEHFTWNFNE